MSVEKLPPRTLPVHLLKFLTEPETVEELRRLLTEARPTKTCDEVDWALFGVSMATYNVATSLALAVGSFWGAEKIRRQA